MIKDFYFGSYAEKEKESIYKYRLNTETLQLEKIWSFSGVENPSYVLAHPNGKILYAVEELSPKGRVAVFEITENGLNCLQQLSSHGADPCHLSMDEKSEFLCVANYSSGSLAMYRLDQDGKIMDLCDHKQHTGSSIYAPRQESAHVHFSAFSGDQLLVCDLGEDLIYNYKLDRQNGKLLENTAPIQVPEGYGPRHLILDPADPDRFYVITEMEAALLSYRKEDTAYILDQCIPALPENQKPDDLPTVPQRAVGAAIRISEDGCLLCVSLRGYNGLALFSKGDDGKWSKTGVFSSEGKIPRDFYLFGTFILCAHQGSGDIRLLSVEKESGIISGRHVSVSIPSPVCIAPVR